MDLQLEQVGPERLDDVVEFLRKTFRAPLDAPFLQTDQVRWRFFETRPDWDGSRSYVFRVQGAIVAHACVVPTTFLTPAGTTFRSIFPIDWAASPSVPGAGILLLKEITSLADVRIGYGGTPVTKEITSKMHTGRKHAYERVIGDVMRAKRMLPRWSASRDRPTPRWRTIARVGREAWRNSQRRLSLGSDWAARPVERFDARLPNQGPGNPTGLSIPLRTPELLNYMLTCPGAGFSGFLLEKNHALRGHLLLTNLGEETRVADLVIDSDSSGDWAACYSLAASTAKQRYPRCNHLTAMAAPEFLQTALLRAGFLLSFA